MKNFDEFDLTLAPRSMLLTEKQVSAWTGFSSQTMRRWRADGKGPVFVKLNHLIRYPVGELMDWMERCKSVA